MIHPQLQNNLLCLNSNLPDIFDTQVNYSLTDLEGLITNVSAAFSEETGYQKHEVIGKTHAFLRSPDFPMETYSQLWDTIINDQIWEGQIKNIRKNGDSYWIRSVIQPYYNKDDEKIGYLAIRQNITQEKKCEALSLVDELTGIYNRRKFNLELHTQLINFYRYQKDFSLAMIDIDHFKLFNDTYGHLIGDQVLKRACEVISCNIRRGDFFARWGGEEFVLILQHIDKESAKTICQKLLEKIRLDLPKYLIEAFDIQTTLSCSMGITSPKNSDDIETLIVRSDAALYYAKNDGRDCIKVL